MPCGELRFLIMATLTINDRTAALLRERADARGVTIEDYLRDVAERDERPTPVPLIYASRAKPMTPAEREQWWRDLEALPPVAASLPPDFSRAELYDDDGR